MKVFSVLMWKHYIMRKRHKCMTILEVFTPLFMLLPLIAFRSVTKDIQETELRSAQSMQAPRLVYTPNTELTRILMAQVADTLYLPRYEAVPKEIELTYMRSHEIKTDAALNLIDTVDALVVFENLKGEHLPDCLNYTIHVKQPQHLTLLSRKRNYEHLDELGESFLRLQWAIDASFIKMKSNSVADLQNITMKQIRGNAPEKLSDRTLSDIIFFSLIAVTFIAPIFSFTQIMLRMNEEKTTGIQEISEMAGASSTVICLSQLLNSFPPSLVMAIGSTVLCQLLKIEAHPVITFIGWFLQYMTVIAMAFIYSYITKTILYTISVSMFLYVVTWFPVILLGAGSFTAIGMILKGLLPHAPFLWFIHQIFVASDVDGGIDFSTWSGEYHRYDDDSRSGSVQLSFVMQIIQIVFCSILTLYFDLVRPRKFGIRFPWYFPCQKEYWMKTKKKPEMEYLSNINRDPAYERFFEEPPEQAIEAVNVVKLQKMYRTNTGAVIYALDNVSAKFYKDEITVIIGHNGSGKSTLISIIAGMLKQTSGKVYVDGLDTLKRQVDLRQKVALCPQNNILYPDLTVREHFMFFCMMRGDTMKKAEDYSEELMKQLDLYSKETWTPEKMSHGMLRRLQVGCVLCGDASLLLLDEPTTGLDVESRRNLWDILLTLRGHRTVIMSTHYMDEADVLGDRIMGLHSGILRCYATPDYLKKAVGSGYRVSITTRQLPDLHRISSVMREMSPDTELNDKVLRTLVYDISLITDMDCLFTKLEALRCELDIESIGISTVTLEEAFMKLCNDVGIDAFHEGAPFLKNPDEFCYNHGWILFLTQTRELFKRQFDFTLSKIVPFFILQFLCPMALCFLLCYVLNNPSKLTYLKMDLNMYNEVDAPVASYNIKINSSDNREIIAKLKSAYPHLIFRGPKDKQNHNSFCDCDKCKTHKKTFSRDIIDVYVDDHQAKLNYDRSVKHSASVGLNLLSNIIATQRLTSTHVQPISMRVIYGYFDWKQPKSELNCYILASMSVFGALYTCISAILAAAVNDVWLPCRERIEHTRYLHTMTGCPPVLYWTVTLLYHMATYLLFYCSGILLAVAFLDRDDTLDNVTTLSAYSLALVICGMNFYTFVYFLSFFFNEKIVGLIVLLLLIYFGLYAHLIKFAYENLDVSQITLLVVDNLSMFVPMYIFVLSIKSLTYSARSNQMCLYYHTFCSQPQSSHDYPSNVCCDRSMGYGHWFSPYELTIDGMAVPLLIIAAHVVIFTTLVLLMEYQVMPKLWNKVEKRRAFPLPTRKYDNPDVFAEKEYIRNTIQRPTETIKETMLVSRCWKVYFLLFRTKLFVLKDINFCLKRGECFGLIGLNGCGKSSAYKAMTRNVFLTKGNIYASNYFMDKNTRKYLHSLGYCHQPFGLDLFRTGENNLRTLMVFRGILASDIITENNAWFKVIGLDQYRSYLVSKYSSGLRQRLSATSGLCGGTPVMLMDEPTSGLDPAVRRLVWEALEHSLIYGRSLVIASHNLEEVERLCTNFSILDEGEMGTLATPTHFRLLCARGHTVHMKLRIDCIITETGASRVEMLKVLMLTELNSSLRSDHLTSVSYTVAARMQYSEVYNKVSHLAQEFADIVEDYAVYDGTLEDGFFQFLEESRYNIRQAQTW